MKVKLTPVLRSRYPPCAAVSLVVLSPTNEGRVCDIQLVIIAMVLSTTPIFSRGTDIFPLGLFNQFLALNPSSFHKLRTETGSRGAQSIFIFRPGLRLGSFFRAHLRVGGRTPRERAGSCASSGGEKVRKSAERPLKSFSVPRTGSRPSVRLPPRRAL